MSSGTSENGRKSPNPKPILSSPGSYMSTFQSATIHSINKTHDKPVVPARPVLPPVVPPKYASTLGKVDREREKVWNFQMTQKLKSVVRFIFLFCIRYSSSEKNYFGSRAYCLQLLPHSLFKTFEV